jgi:hypothetical protein
MQRLLDADAAADMLARENSGFSVDASVRITLLRPHLRVSCQPLEHLLRYRARPPFALERLSVIRGEDGRIARVRYVLPRHKASNWVGPGARAEVHAAWRQRRPRADETNPALSEDRKHLGTSTIGSHPARSAPAVAPHDPPRSADACRSTVGRPILCDGVVSCGKKSWGDTIRTCDLYVPNVAVPGSELVAQTAAVTVGARCGILSPQHGRIECCLSIKAVHGFSASH